MIPERVENAFRWGVETPIATADVGFCGYLQTIANSTTMDMDADNGPYPPLINRLLYTHV